MTILLTGFGPFGSVTDNPTDAGVREAAQRLRDAGVAVVDEVLPVSFARARGRLRALIAEHQPTWVICFGLAENRDAVTPERVAINLADARIADVDGAQPVDEELESDGPAAYFSSLPLKAIVGELGASGMTAKLSSTAGEYVCNAVFYEAMARLPDGARGGFVHVPLGVDVARVVEVVVHTVLADG